MTPTDARDNGNDADSARPDVAAQLQRILDAVAPSRPGWLELALVILLAITALGSTWCAYQSQLWNGVQLVQLVDADLATQQANEHRLAALQQKSLDAMSMFHYLEAVQRKDVQLADAIQRRMQSPMREAMEAWLKLDPLNNPDIPPPGKMAQYVLDEDERAKVTEAKAGASRAAAQQSGQNGDTYVLLTLMYASVLFFGGIANTFQSRRLRIGMGGVACVLFVVTTIRVAFMPVCSG